MAASWRHETTIIGKAGYPAKLAGGTRQTVIGKAGYPAKLAGGTRQLSWARQATRPR